MKREGEIKRQREKKRYNEASSGRDRGAVNMKTEQ